MTCCTHKFLNKKFIHFCPSTTRFVYFGSFANISFDIVLRGWYVRLYILKGQYFSANYWKNFLTLNDHVNFGILVCFFLTKCRYLDFSRKQVIDSMKHYILWNTTERCFCCRNNFCGCDNEFAMYITSILQQGYKPGGS